MKRLKKSRTNSVIFGVCGGIGEYFNIDPLVVRIIWVLLLIPSFTSSAVIYLVCSFIMPEDDNIINQDEVEQDNNKSTLLVGSILVILGLFFLAREFIPHFMIIRKFWPILFIIAGVYIIFNKRD